MFGYSAEEAVGRSIRMIIPADRQGEEDQVLAKIRAGQAVTHYETLRLRRDGSVFPISLTVSPVYDDSGRVIGASKIARDISDRHQADQAIRAHEQDARRLGQIGAIVTSTLNRDTILQKVTEAAIELTHAEFGVFSARFRHHAAIRIDDLTAHPADAEESPIRTIPGNGLPARSYLAVPINAWAGEVIGGLFFAHSSPGKFTEQHERLAVGVSGWASLALENARLFVEAQNANRMKDEFLAVLSHELRTPLNAIVGYSRLLRGGMLSPEKAERGLETLERNAKWLTQIVDDVLDVSRIVSGKIRLDVQPVDLAPVIGNAVATVLPGADAKGVRLHTVIDPKVGPVSGDPDRLQQVIWNLLANAVKFTPRGGRIQLQLERVNSHLEISVSDTGQGISAEFLPYVFDRFRQADAGTTRRAGGLGLGLAIVRHIVEMHGGAVYASSAGEGQGATFRVTLPLMSVQPARPDHRREHPRTETVTPLVPLSGLTGIRVLAVDDEPDALSLLKVVLETAGADVTTIASPRQALDRIESLSPHVIVADVGMPDMDGFELITRIRGSENQTVREIPAAALTAFARSEDRTKALRSGFELHLAKPVDPGELVAAVAALARRSKR
jgi:PAS domain S-box-containing protein